MVEVVFTDEFGEWFAGLGAEDEEKVFRSVERLRTLGLALGYPQSSAIKGTVIALRELRIQSGGRPVRVFYAFDPARQVVLLIGGDKGSHDRFYEEMIPRAETIWANYLVETKQQKKGP